MATQQKKYKLSSVFNKLARDNSTGTLICVNENNLQGRIYFRDGRPEMARCRNLQGREAIELINEHLLVSLRFNSNQNLITLNKNNTDQSINSGKDDTTPLALVSGDTSLEAPMTDETKTILIEELTEQLGPLAGILVEDLDSNLRLIDALDSLAAEIDDAESTSLFIDNVKKRI